MLESQRLSVLEKTPTGIDGLDEVTGGGLPRSRTSLVCGGPGCGKTVLGVQFLVHGALERGEPGVLMAFEETPAALAQNFASLGWDLDGLVERNLLAVDQVRLEPAEVVETGAWDLDALMLRLNAAIESVGARRVVLDTIEVLFAALSDERLLRSELRRLFGWLGGRGVSALVTGERGDGGLTRHGLEEYVSDCVIMLDQRLEQQSGVRRLRIAKYRGSAHGSDEYPFLITERGLSLLPLSSMRLEHSVATERVSLGVAELDRMLSGGVYRGTTVLVTGMPGAGKTTLGALFADAACAAGERVIVFTFEESPDQLVRNMASVGVELGGWRERGLLRVVATRPEAFGVEAQLAQLHGHIERFDPRHVVFDPVSGFGGADYEVEAMLARLVDWLKTRGVTALLTALVRGKDDDAGLGISSVVDSWIQLTNHEQRGERNHGISIVKSRGMAHSAQLREFRLTDHGFELREPYASGGEVLMGTARQAKEAEDQVALLRDDAKVAARRRAWERRRATLEAQLAALRETLDGERDDFEQELAAAEAHDRRRELERAELVSARRGRASDGDSDGPSGAAL